MKKIIYLIFIVLLIAPGVFLVSIRLNKEKNVEKNEDILVSQVNGSISESTKNAQNNLEVKENIFSPPIDRFDERVTKKPFGIFITPKNSPVQPEKFSGYHTGVDFEIFLEEDNKDVFVKAVCAGKLLDKKYATGYGGVLVQSCDLEEEPITVVYGHLKLDSIKVAIGDDIATGEALGVLGRAYSPETSGERKHLHLGFHKGKEINILGYVSSKNLTSNWLDPMLFLK